MLGVAYERSAHESFEKSEFIFGKGLDEKELVKHRKFIERLGKMALSTGLKVISFDYRLSPEHAYPEALDDGMALWEYLTETYDPDHIIIAGDSAGGNLALCLTQKLKSTERKLPKGLVLFSPWTDMTCSWRPYLKGIPGLSGSAAH